MKSMETKLTTERERHVREMAAVREEFRNTLTEERETHKKEVEELKQLLAEQKRETESKMAEQKREIKVNKTIAKRSSDNCATPLQDEYTSKMAEMEKSLLGVKKMEEEMKGNNYLCV